MDTRGRQKNTYYFIAGFFKMKPTRHRSHSGPIAKRSHSQLPVTWSHDPILPKTWHLHTEKHNTHITSGRLMSKPASTFLDVKNKRYFPPWQPVGSSCLRLKKPCLQRSQRRPSTFSLQIHRPLRASHRPPPWEPAGSQSHAETQENVKLRFHCRNFP